MTLYWTPLRGKHRPPPILSTADVVCGFCFSCFLVTSWSNRSRKGVWGRFLREPGAVYSWKMEPGKGSGDLFWALGAHFSKTAETDQNKIRFRGRWSLFRVPILRVIFNIFVFWRTWCFMCFSSMVSKQHFPYVFPKCKNSGSQGEAWETSFWSFLASRREAEK